MPRDRVDLLIVGGGVGGLALALALRGRGYRIEILEREALDSGPRPSRRGDLLQPNGLTVMERLGVLEAVKVAAVPIVTWRYYGADGTPLTSRDYRVLDHPHPYALSLLSHRTRQVLLDRAVAEPGIRLRPGSEVTSLIRDGDRLAGAVVQEGGAAREIEARLIVGADGAQSATRNAMGIQAAVRQYREGYLTMVIGRPAGFGAEGRLYFGTRTYVGIVPVSPDASYAFFYVDPSRYPEIRRQGLDALKAEIEAAVPAVAAGLTRLTAWDDLSYWPCVSVRCARWVIAGGALLGDAAHAISPHVAQGTNQALVDAWTLAEVAGRALDRDDCSAGALAPYETSRRPAVEFLQRLAEEYALFFPPRGWLLGRLRDRALRCSNANPRLQRKDVATVAGLSTDGYSLYDRLCVLGWPDPWARHLPAPAAHALPSPQRQEGAGEGIAPQ